MLRRSKSRRPACLTLLLLAMATTTACSDAFDAEGLSHCEQAIEGQFPAQGSPNAFGGGWIVLDLHCSSIQPAVQMQPQQGAAWQVPTQVSHNGRQVRALPGVPLAPNARFIVEFDDLDISSNWVVTTSSLGSALQYPLAGHSEELVLDEGSLLSPASLTEALIERMHAVRPLVHFLGEPTSSTISGRLGALMAEADLQDDHWTTMDRSFDWQAPYFSFGPLDLRWQSEGWTLVLEQARFSGAPHPVLAGIGAVNVKALWDTREAEAILGGSLGLGSSPGALCRYALEHDGSGCIPCADGNASCLDFLLLNVPTRYWPGQLHLVE